MAKENPIDIKIFINEVDNGFILRISIGNSDSGSINTYVENLHQASNIIDKSFQKFISYYLKFKKEE